MVPSLTEKDRGTVVYIFIVADGRVKIKFWIGYVKRRIFFR